MNGLRNFGLAPPGSNAFSGLQQLQQQQQAWQPFLELQRQQLGLVQRHLDDANRIAAEDYFKRRANLAQQRRQVIGQGLGPLAWPLAAAAARRQQQALNIGLGFWGGQAPAALGGQVLPTLPKQQIVARRNAGFGRDFRLRGASVEDSKHNFVNGICTRCGHSQQSTKYFGWKCDPNQTTASVEDR